MSEYKEALKLLDLIDTNLIQRMNPFFDVSELNKWKSMLKDLVNKETPMKLKTVDGNKHMCACLHYVSKYNDIGDMNDYCGGCGNKMDWSNDNE